METAATALAPVERALVVGGGGATGLAWAAGVVHGLCRAGVDLAAADAVVGTSAGAVVGTAVASDAGRGHEGIDLLFTRQLSSHETEVVGEITERWLVALAAAYREGGADPEATGRALGRLARSHEPVVGLDRRRATIEHRLVSHHWPTGLTVMATDATTGRAVGFTSESGVPLVDVVMASGAMPGMWAAPELDGRLFVDGGLVSTTHARLAAACGRVVVLAPLAAAIEPFPGPAEELAERGDPAGSLLIVPDEESLAAMGANMFDPTNRPETALAGQRQGAGLAPEVAALWS
jgi:NTE family protein